MDSPGTLAWGCDAPATVTRSRAWAIIAAWMALRIPFRRAGALGLLVLSTAVSCARPPAVPAPGPSVVLFGIDAGDWEAIDPLTRAGELPNLGRLRAHGRTGVLRAEPPLVSPILWTTIATGRPADEHGVLDFVVDLPGGGQAPVAATSRRVPALWNLFSRARRSSAVIGWWATWPVETIVGTIVSDRVAPQLTRALPEIDAGSVFPASAIGRFNPLLVSAASITTEELMEHVPVAAARVATARAGLGRNEGAFYADPVTHLAATVAATRTYGAIAEEALRSDRPALLAVYFEAVDTVSHRFVRDGSLGPAAISAAYRDVDAVLGRLARAAPPDAWFVICSDHGFHSASADVREDPANLTGPATAWHRPYGIVGAIRADVLAGHANGVARDVGLVSPLDIAPTVLTAAGLPPTTRMTGRVVDGLVPDGGAAATAPRVEVPDAAPQGTAARGPLDAEVEARLRALGYVGSTPSSLARLNLAEALYRRGRLDAAARELRARLESRPDDLSALLWSARIAADQGRAAEAMVFYARAARVPGSAADVLVPAATLAARSGLATAMEPILADLSEAERTSAPARTAQGLLELSRRRPRDAEREFRAALARDPAFAEALTGLLELLASQGRAAAAVPVLRRGAERAPHSPRHLALYGAALLGARSPGEAEQVLASALRLAPDGDAVRVDLARAQLGLGKAAAALDVLGPTAPSMERALLRGAAFSLLDQWPAASAEYRSALALAPQPGIDLLNALAWAELKQGRTKEAAALLDRSLGLRHDQSEIARLRASLRGRS